MQKWTCENEDKKAKTGEREMKLEWGLRALRKNIKFRVSNIAHEILILSISVDRKYLAPNKQKADSKEKNNNRKKKKKKK